MKRRSAQHTRQAAEVAGFQRLHQRVFDQRVFDRTDRGRTDRGLPLRAALTTIRRSP